MVDKHTQLSRVHREVRGQDGKLLYFLCVGYRLLVGARYALLYRFVHLQTYKSQKYDKNTLCYKKSYRHFLTWLTDLEVLFYRKGSASTWIPFILFNSRSQRLRRS